MFGLETALDATSNNATATQRLSSVFDEFVAIFVHAFKLLSEELFLLAEDELERCCLLTEQNSLMKDN